MVGRFFSVVLVLFLIVSCDSASTENDTFIKIYGSFDQDEAVGLDFSETLGQYVFLGSTNSSDLKLRETDGESDAVLLFANQQGNIDESVIFQDSTDHFNQGSSLFKTADETFLIGVTTLERFFLVDGVPSDAGQGNREQVIQVVRFNERGDFASQRTMGYLNDDEVNFGDLTPETTVSEVIQDAEESVLVLGSTNIVNVNKEGFNASTDESDILLYKLNSNLEFIFSRRYGNNGIDEGVDIVEREDGGYIILGTTNREKLNQASEAQGVQNILLIYVNNNGDIEETIVTGTDNNDQPTEIIKRSGIDNYVVVGSVSSRIDATVERGFFLNVLGSGSISDIKLISSFEGGYNSGLSSIKEDGLGYMAVGFSENGPGINDGLDNDTDVGKQITLFPLDASGEIDDDLRYFGWEGDDFGKDLIVQSDGIAIVGTVDFGGDSKVIGLIRTNRAGNL